MAKGAERRAFPVPIVGESHYRTAVKATKVGDYVDLILEEGNPHAAGGKALRVDNMDGDTIGYIAEDNWAYRAIVSEEQGALARVLSKHGGRGAPTGIVLEVQLGPEEVPRVPYGRSPPRQATSGCLLIFALLPLGAFAGYISGHII
jgi:hypothetical protein